MLKESDKRVVRAFVNEKPASSNLLETDGVRLDKIGLGGETVAKWLDGRIAIVSTESVKSDESIIRLIKSVAGPGVVDFSYARKGHRVHEHGAMGRNGRGIYHETAAGKHDVVIHQDHRGAWRTDLVTSSGGNHVDIGGSTKGYSSPFDAFNGALAEKHRRGLATRGLFWIADRDGNLSEYAADEPMERNARAKKAAPATTSSDVRSPTRTEVRSPTRTSTKAYTRGNFTSTVTGGAGAGETSVTINLPGGGYQGNGRKKSVTVSDLKTGGGGMQLVCPGCGATFGADKSDYFQMGPREVFKCMECGANLQLSKKSGPRPTALDEGWAEDDYVVSVIDRDGTIGLFRVQRGGWRNTDPLTVGYKLDQISDVAEQDAHAHGVQDAVVWDGDEGRQIGHVTHGRWEVEMETNGRATTVDPVAARELDLYIANTYELVAAPNSIGKSIDTNLRRKVASGKYDSALAPKAWQYLVDEGAKKYEREFGSDSPIFNAATRRQVATDFARAWEEENGLNSAR